MEGGQCIQPPKTTPTPRPIPTLESGLKGLTTALTRTTSFILIIFVVITLLIFAIFRIFNRGRFIHMNIEVALLVAHICLIPNFVGEEDDCRNISICIHFFYTAVFAFYVVEAVYVYANVSYVVPKDGMLSNMGNFMAGWGMAVVVIAFTISFEYDSYGGDYQ